MKRNDLSSVSSRKAGQLARVSHYSCHCVVEWLCGCVVACLHCTNIIEAVNEPRIEDEFKRRSSSS